jgi:hypothetical protein
MGQTFMRWSLENALRRVNTLQMKMKAIKEVEVIKENDGGGASSTSSSSRSP